MPDTPATEFHEAAELLREAASNATPGPWRPHDTHLLDHGGHTATVMTDRADLNGSELIAWVPTMSNEPWDETRNAWRNAGWMAFMHPGVGIALAEWMDAMAVWAREYPEMAHDHDRPACEDYACDVMGRGIALARQILGTETPA
jgi:hypothetical protein